MLSCFAAVSEPVVPLTFHYSVTITSFRTRGGVVASRKYTTGEEFAANTPQIEISTRRPFALTDFIAATLPPEDE